MRCSEEAAQREDQRDEIWERIVLGLGDHKVDRAWTELHQAQEGQEETQTILKKMTGLDRQSEGGRHFCVLLVGPREGAPSGHCRLFLPACWEGHCWDSEVPRAHAPVPSTCHFLRLVPGPSEPFLLSLPVLGS